MEEEDEEEQNEIAELEEEGEKENEEGADVAKPKKKRKRKCKTEALTEEPSDKKNKMGEKSNEGTTTFSSFIKVFNTCQRNKCVCNIYTCWFYMFR